MAYIEFNNVVKTYGAQNIAVENGNNSVEEEHLLLSLVSQQGGLVGEIFKSIGASPENTASALDAAAEYELFARLGETAKEKTTIFISHRLSSTLFCDSIAVIDKGKVIEQGSHAEMMEKNGFYAELYQSQAKYYKNN